MLSESIRKNIFWLIDFLKGSKIRKHYKDIQNNFSNSIESNKRLNMILNYAVNNIDFYSKYKEFKSLQDFPIINKSIIKDNIGLFKSGCYSKKNCYKLSTSGVILKKTVINYQQAVQQVPHLQFCKIKTKEIEY